MKTSLPDCLRPLTPEELDAVEPISDEEIEAALEKGHRLRELADQRYPVALPCPDLLYR